jgi:hypothetical protein
MAKRTRRQAFQQFWEEVQRLQQAGQPLREGWERYQRWLDEELPSESSGEQAPPRTLPAKRRGGRRLILTDEEVKRLQTAYPTIRAESRNQASAFTKLRKLLPPGKRGISDTALREHISKPIAPK